MRWDDEMGDTNAPKQWERSDRGGRSSIIGHRDASQWQPSLGPERFRERHLQPTNRSIYQSVAVLCWGRGTHPQILPSPPPPN